MDRPVSGTEFYDDLLTKALDLKLQEFREPNSAYFIVDENPEDNRLSIILRRHFKALLDITLDNLESHIALGLVVSLIETMASHNKEIIHEVPEGIKTTIIKGLVHRSDVPTEAAARRQIEATLPHSGFNNASLFTGKEPHFSLVEELRREIRSSQNIDFIVSFLRWSGVILILADLEDAIRRGAKVRIISTVYLGATDAKAVAELQAIGAEIRLSYNTSHGRLHAKAWVFHRPRKLGTAYVGSSNLSKDAITDGLEWNVKTAERETPDLFKHTAACFEAIWHDPEFIPWQQSDLERLKDALSSAKFSPGTFRLKDLPVDLQAAVRSAMKSKQKQTEFIRPISPFRFQEEVLEKIQAERKLHKRNRNLVVLPTGTGKTVVAAFDYSRQIDGPRPRLLFVAHREELLKQALHTFRRVLQDPDFGEIWNSNYQPRQWNHLFVSTLTLHSNQNEAMKRWTPDYFDYIVLDEAHHGRAASYRFLLEYFKPTFLLGMTATPERMDASPIAADFHGRFAAEVRLVEGITRELLVPFHYFGIAEGMPNLSDISWNGSYDKTELEHCLGGDPFALAVLTAMNRILAEPSNVKAVAFCVGLAQAKFMAEEFTKRGLKADWVSSTHEPSERSNILQKFQDGSINYLFTVDLLNEGVDIPAIDTVLFLRPTESLTIFLQQLGRGLRHSPDKSHLTVLDFVGQAHRQYDFRHKFQAMLGISKGSVKKEVIEGYPSLAPGCAIVLERQAERIILQNIARYFPNTRKKILDEVQAHQQLDFSDFLGQMEWEAEFLLKKGGLWYQLRNELQGKGDFDTKRELAIRDWVLNKLLLSDDLEFLSTWKISLQQQNLNQHGHLLIQQVATFGGPGVWTEENEAWSWLCSVPERVQELIAWIEWHSDHIETLQSFSAYQGQLKPFCSYDQKTIAWAQGKRASFGKANIQMQGVERVSYSNDSTEFWNLYVTIKKDDANFSVQTQYQDYAKDQTLFHWESPNNWVPEKLQGKRFLEEITDGIPVYLFVRTHKVDTWGRVTPYMYLGEVHLVEESVQGERPIAMDFKLQHTMPMTCFSAFMLDAAG